MRLGDQSSGVAKRRIAFLFAKSCWASGPIQPDPVPRRLVFQKAKIGVFVHPAGKPKKVGGGGSKKIGGGGESAHGMFPARFHEVVCSNPNLRDRAV